MRQYHGRKVEIVISGLLMKLACHGLETRHPGWSIRQACGGRYLPGCGILRHAEAELSHSRGRRLLLGMIFRITVLRDIKDKP